MTEKHGNGNGLSDVSKSGISLPVLWVLGGGLIAGLGAFYGQNERQAKFETALIYEGKLDELRVQLTKEQIENSGLRNSAMSLSMENSRLNVQCTAKGR